MSQKMRGTLPCRGFGGILGASQCAPTALSRDGVLLRQTGGLVVDSPQDEGCPPTVILFPIRLRRTPQEEWGTKGVDVLSWDGMVGRHPIDKTALQGIDWSESLGLS